PIARAHRARVEFAAIPVVVAHLSGLGETLCGIVAGARRGFDSGQGVAVDVPGGPVELRLERPSAIARAEAEQRWIVHLRRRDDLARVHAIARIEQRLDLAECAVDIRAELPRDPFAAAQAVAVLAGIRALVFADHRRGLFGDRAHFRGAAAAHVENRPHVQRTDAGVRVPGAG